MLITGNIVSYNSLNRTALVSISGWGVVSAQNVLPANVEPSLNVANNFLERYELNTVMPANNFQSPESVGLIQDGTDWVLLGHIVANSSENTTFTGRPGPGLLNISNSISTDGSGTFFIREVGERAWINQIKVVSQAGGNFTVKVYNSANQLQASWGDGSVTLSNTLEDVAGFYFTSESRVAKLVLSPAGNYQVSLFGERFA